MQGFLYHLAVFYLLQVLASYIFGLLLAVAIELPCLNLEKLFLLDSGTNRSSIRTNKLNPDGSRSREPSMAVYSASAEPKIVLCANESASSLATVMSVVV